MSTGAALATPLQGMRQVPRYCSTSESEGIRFRMMSRNERKREKTCECQASGRRGRLLCRLCRADARPAPDLHQTPTAALDPAAPIAPACYPRAMEGSKVGA